MCTSLAMNMKRFYFGRNMDLDGSFGEMVVITPRRFPFFFRMGEMSLSHYAMIGMAAVMDGYPLYADAVNEKGLCMAGLNFPENAVYSKTSEKGKHNISPFELIPWVLSSCSTLLEARALLEKTHMVAIPFREDIPLTPLHWHIADKNGSLVLEITDEGMMLYENSVGVLTNNPPFPFHMHNLCHYANLTNVMTKTALSETHQIKPFGMGLGAHGLVGDYSSASRFVKTVFLRTFSEHGDDDETNIMQFFHILGAVAPVKGSVLTSEGRSHFTTYSACIDAEDGVYYYQTYDNPQITAVALHTAVLDGENLSLFPLFERGKILFEKS